MTPTPEEYLSRLSSRFPESNPKLTPFPSGAFMIDLEIQKEALVIEYLPSFGKFGVSKLSTAVFGWEGVENAFDTADEVEAYLGDLSKPQSKK